MLSDDAVRLIRETVAAAPHGSRGAVVRDLAVSLGVSEATVWRRAQRGGARKARPPRKPEYREWTRIAAAIAHRAPKPISLDLAIEAGVDSGELPAEAETMPVGTAHRIAREELGLRIRRLHRRMSADWPMQAVQLDGSTSEHLYPLRRRDDGEWVIAVHRGPASPRGYKNRPLGPDRERLLVTGVWDMCTGHVRSRYRVARGEDAAGELEALLWLLRDHGDPRSPMHGAPEDLWIDQGPLAHSQAAIDLLSRLGIAATPGAPGRKERMGGVERAHSTRWRRFERALHLGAGRMALDELNERLWEFEARENSTRPARVRVAGRRATRSQAWVALVNARPADNPLRRLPEDALRTAAVEAERVVSAGGTVRWEGDEWEIEGAQAAALAGRRVTVRRPLVGVAEAVTVELGDVRALARPLRPRPYGEVPHQAPTPLEALRAADAEAEAPEVDLFGTRREPAALPMRARSAEPEPIDDPLTVPDAYPDTDSAMREMASLCPTLTSAQLARVRDRLERTGLSRRTVHELAAQLTRAAAGGRR